MRIISPSIIVSTVILLFFGCSLNGTIFAQQDSSRHPFFPVILSDAKLFFTDAGMFFTSPLRFSGDDWLLTGATAGGTAALFLADKDVRSLMHRNQTQFLNDFSDVSRIYGEDYFGVGLSAGMYGTGLFTKNRELKMTGFMVFESITFSAAITQTIKMIAGRSRPYVNKGNTDFHPFTIKEERVSLPSGHSTVAFAISSVLAGRINNTYASIGLYTLASCTALSRVYSDEHWASDIVLGSVIGFVTGNAVLHLHDKETNTSSLHFTPMLNGVRAEFRF